MQEYSGRCLCGHISYKVEGKPAFPHLCSCKMCQKWSGALTVAWTEFPIKTLTWNGPGGEPAFYRSSKKTQRGFCPKCGSTLCALDDGYENISITIASLREPSSVIPGNQHSYQEEAPSWWKVRIES
ncbi:GFA family protein [Rickettsiales endosymbiont of Stachyamoeba lipophora]|uniref:GFA family protein n=1 Tax=Rickettsiales endosymbiont of Stachyamoeba lipophora TaxID=2486578 RepID=UPI0013DDB84B|nr:GFA family protein [Rickettsiales endosymbiont of Stachyamoeba lipophora]